MKVKQNTGRDFCSVQGSAVFMVGNAKWTSQNEELRKPWSCCRKTEQPTEVQNS